MNRNSKGSALLVIILSLVLISVFALFIWTSLDEEADSPVVDRISSPIKKLVPTPTLKPFPFQEMTIEALRDREYEGEVKQMDLLRENSEFKTYFVTYDSDGLDINGLMTVPVGETPNGGWPAVVFVHGYIPPAEYKTDKNYVSYMESLANDGLVVFKIDLRGHDESEGYPHGAYFSEGYVVDTLNAHSALSKLDDVNPSQIGLWGHSMGGNVVFRSFVAKSVPKVVIWAGAVYSYDDFVEYRISDSSYQRPREESPRQRRRDKLFGTYGEFDSSHEFWDLIAPTNYLDGVEGEVQLHHAINDNVVDMRYSTGLVDLLELKNIKNEYFEYASGGHNLTGASFTEAMRRSAEFLTDY